MRAKWIANVRTLVNWNTALVCSMLFVEEDFKRDLRNELLGLPQRRMLKEGAVPSRRVQRHEDQLKLLYLLKRTEASTQMSESWTGAEQRELFCTKLRLARMLPSAIKLTRRVKLVQIKLLLRYRQMDDEWQISFE